MRFHPRKIICLGRFLITLLFLIVSVVFLNILSLIFTYLHILSHFSVRDNFIFYSHLKMTSERSKRGDLLSLSFITKSISKRLLIKIMIFTKTS